MATPGISSLVAGQVLPEYRVRAHNAAEESENKIHNTEVARQYGFEGGLVPGVTVYAYMTRPVMEALGLAWLERGQMSVRLLKPFYEGQPCTVRATVKEAVGGKAALEVAAANDEGVVCATGVATLSEAACETPDVDAYPVAPLAAQRPPATLETMSGITVLGTVDATYDLRAQSAFLEEVADDLPLYRGPEAIVPSGYLIRGANTVLAANVRLGPWIHASSEVTHLGLARTGETISTRGRVVGLFERRGHKFVDLDVLMMTRGTRPVMRVQHTAIYDVRKTSSE